VRAQVDRDLTTVSWVDRLLGLVKNLGHHITATNGSWAAQGVKDPSSSLSRDHVLLDPAYTVTNGSLAVSGHAP
jgi:hypothetical protein